MEEREFPKRKNPRLAGFDYSSRRFYFLTICTRERAPCLCRIEGTPEKPCVHLLPAGQIVDRELTALPQRTPGLAVEKAVVMPDHIHLIVSIGCYGGDDPPSLSRIVGNFKGGVSRQYGRPVWQTSFYDHVIRGPADFKEIVEYIENNPRKWLLKREQQK